MIKKGIDLSYHNGIVDFKKVKSDGIDFVIIRAGFGKSGKDIRFMQNIKGAIDNGLKIGVYWFIYAKNKQDIIANAKMCDALIRNYKDKIDLGVWADFEYDSDRYAGKLTNTERTEMVKLFIDEMNNKGYECGLYANPDYIKNKFNYKVENKVGLHKYKLWLAWYDADENKVLEYKPIIWQKSSKGVIKGVKGNVDINVYYGTEKPNSSQIETYEIGIVTTKGSNLNVRKGKGTKYEIIGKFKNGTEITILEKDKSWYYVTDGNITGYVSNRYIKEK